LEPRASLPACLKAPATLPAAPQVLLLCALLAASATAARAEEAVDWPACPEGLAGVDCGTCTEDVGAAVIAMHPNATCYTNHTYTWETTQKSYACSTEVRVATAGRGVGAAGGSAATRIVFCACPPPACLYANAANLLAGGHPAVPGTPCKVLMVCVPMCPSAVGTACCRAAAVQGTPVQDSITNVWGSCFTDVKKCDFGMAISGHGLTCSGLNCVFEESCECCGLVGYCCCRGSWGIPPLLSPPLLWLLPAAESKGYLLCRMRMPAWPAGWLAVSTAVPVQAPLLNPSCPLPPLARLYCSRVLQLHQVLLRRHLPHRQRRQPGVHAGEAHVSAQLQLVWQDAVAAGGAGWQGALHHPPACTQPLSAAWLPSDSPPAT
jgi:hypothetical protein